MFNYWKKQVCTSIILIQYTFINSNYINHILSYSTPFKYTLFSSKYYYSFVSLNFIIFFKFRY